MGSRERKRVKNLGRAKRPSPALGATALSEGGRFLGKPTIAEGQDGYGWCFLRQCGTYPPAETSLSWSGLLLFLVCRGCVHSLAQTGTQQGRPTRQTSHSYTFLAYTCSDYIHLMDVMPCLPDLRRCATKTRMNRAVGRCSVRMRQVPRQVFLFPLHPGVERTGEQIIEGGENTPGHVHRAWSELHSLGPPFPSSFRLASSALHAQVDLSCLVLPCPFFACCQHANNSYITHRGSTAQLPARLQILCAAAHPGRRANAAQSSVDFAQEQATTTTTSTTSTHSCNARRCVPRPASYGKRAPGRPIVLVLLLVLQFVG